MQMFDKEWLRNSDVSMRIDVFVCLLLLKLVR